MDTMASGTFISDQHKLAYLTTPLKQMSPDEIVQHWPACRKARYWLPVGHSNKYAAQFFPVPAHPMMGPGTCPGCAMDIWVTIVTGKKTSIPTTNPGLPWMGAASQSAGT